VVVVVVRSGGGGFVRKGERQAFAIEGLAPRHIALQADLLGVLE